MVIRGRYLEGILLIGLLILLIKQKYKLINLYSNEIIVIEKYQIGKIDKNNI